MEDLTAKTHSLDEAIFATIESGSVKYIKGIDVYQLASWISNEAVLRAGVLTARGKLKILGGGGEKPYVLGLGD